MKTFSGTNLIDSFNSNLKFKKKPDKEGDISEAEYRFNNFSKSSQITEVIFKDIIPYGLKVQEVPNNCEILNRKLICELGTFKPKEKKKLKFDIVAEKEYFLNKEDPKNSKPIVEGNSENRLLTLDLKFKNFIDIFTSPNFFKTIRISFIYSLFSAIGSLGLGIIAAQLLMTAFPGRGVIRGIFLIPYIAPIIAVTITWGILMDPFFGTINALLTELDIIAETGVSKSVLAGLEKLQLIKKILKLLRKYRKIIMEVLLNGQKI